MSNEKNIKIKQELNAFLIFIIITGIVSFILIIPSYSGFAIFANGDFIYTETAGMTLGFLTIVAAVIYFLVNKLNGFGNKNKILRYGYPTGIIAAGVILLLFAVGLITMRAEVKKQCIDATRTYVNDCVDALSMLVSDERQNFKARNDAVYALGQIADKRALPVLKRYYKGVKSGREPLHTTLSQYELQKAIRWCEEGNVTSWIYRDFSAQL